MSKVKIKKHFFTGVLATLPLFVTIYILYFIYKIIAGIVMVLLPIEFITQILIENNTHLESKSNMVAFVVFLISILLFSIFVYVAGIYLNKFINAGKSKYVNNIFNKIPLAKSVYSIVEQIRDIVFSKEATTYKRAVIIEYPSEGLYALGLVASEENKMVSDSIEEEVSNVFIPTTPNPTTGFYVVVPKSKLIDTDYTIEEAFKIFISAGALEPERKVEEND